MKTQTAKTQTKKTKKAEHFSKKIIAAAREYLNLKSRKIHPDGEFDKQRRWYPSDDEMCDCCKNIRRPSSSYPFSLMMHCRTAEHVATRYNVDAATLKRFAKKLESANA